MYRHIVDKHYGQCYIYAYMYAYTVLMNEVWDGLWFGLKPIEEVCISMYQYLIFLFLR